MHWIPSTSIRIKISVKLVRIINKALDLFDLAP